MKRLVAILLALLMLGTIGAVAASAAEEAKKSPEPPLATAPAAAYSAIYGKDTTKASDGGSSSSDSDIKLPSNDGYLIKEVNDAQKVRREKLLKAIEAQQKAANEAKLNRYDAVVLRRDGNVLQGYFVRNNTHPDGDVIITPIGKVGSADPAIDANRLQKGYDALRNASDKSALIPEFGQGYKLAGYFDVTAVRSAAANLARPGTSLRVVLNAGVGKGDKVAAYSMNDDGSYDKAISATNNGDGSVTVVLGHLCPVAVLSKGGSSSGGVESPKTADDSANIIWALAAICGLAAVVTLSVSRKRSKAN